MLNDFIPFIALAWFAYFLRNNNLNNPLVGLIFISFLFFSTNYSNFGFDLSFDVFRLLHRLIGVICILMFFWFLKKNKINIFNDWPTRLLILFSLAIVTSYFGNEVYAPHYIHYFRNFIFVALIVLFLYYMLDRNEKLDELFELIGIGALILSCFVLINMINVGWYHEETLFYSNPNYLAISLFAGIPCLLYSKKRALQFCTPIIIVAVFATGSRATELAIFLILFFFMIFKYKDFGIKKITIGLIIILTSLIVFFDKIVIKTSIDGTRHAIAQIVFNIVNENPVNGIGYGQFRTNFYKFVDNDVLKLEINEINDAYKSHVLDYYQPSLLTIKDLKRRNIEKMTHNDLLTITAELGLVGLIFVFFFFYKLYSELKRLLSRSRRDFYFSSSLIIGFLIFSMFHNNLTSFLFWFVLIIPFILNRNYAHT